MIQSSCLADGLPVPRRLRGPSCEPYCAFTHSFVVARNTRVKPSPQVGRVACAGPHAHLAAVADPLVRQKLIDAGAEPLQSSPQEMADHIRKEAAKWAEVIRTANIQLD